MFKKMKTGSLIAIVFITALALSPFAFAGNELGTCPELGVPFSEFSRLVTSSNLPNPPLEQLCLHLANASKHNRDGRLENAIGELEK